MMIIGDDAEFIRDGMTSVAEKLNGRPCCKSRKRLLIFGRKL